MSKKRLNSFRPFREEPSTIFTADEKAARRSCDVRPYRSSEGNVFVTL